MSAIQQTGSEQLAGAIAGPQHTLVVVSQVEHALAIARRLAHWPVVISDNAYLRKLSAGHQAALSRATSGTAITNRAIVTVAALNTIELSRFDAVIWAGGGVELPELPTEALVILASDPRSLLWIDFRDEHHPRLRRHSASRATAYVNAGWLKLGEDPRCARIRRFLNKRPAA